MWTIQNKGHGVCGSCGKKIDCKPLDNCVHPKHKIAYNKSLKKHQRWRYQHKKLLKANKKKYLSQPEVKANRVKLARIAEARREQNYPSGIVLNQKFSS